MPPLYPENGDPYIVHVNFPKTIDDWSKSINESLATISRIGWGNIAFFAGQLFRLACSCQPRLDYKYDPIAWWDFVGCAKSRLRLSDSSGSKALPAPW